MSCIRANMLDKKKSTLKTQSKEAITSEKNSLNINFLTAAATLLTTPLFLEGWIMLTLNHCNFSVLNLIIILISWTLNHQNYNYYHHNHSSVCVCLARVRYSSTTFFTRLPFVLPLSFQCLLTCMITATEACMLVFMLHALHVVLLLWHLTRLTTMPSELTNGKQVSIVGEEKEGEAGWGFDHMQIPHTQGI